jgi:hypothetical protein
VDVVSRNGKIPFFYPVLRKWIAPRRNRSPYFQPKKSAYIIDEGRKGHF